MKLSVIYHSKTGNTKEMALAVVKGMERVEGVEAKAFSIDDVDVDYVQESKAVVFGSPVYYATVSAEMKSYLDSSAGRLKLAGKLCGAFSTANYVHGGGELAIRMMLDHAMVLGAMVYSGGGACGLPVIHIGPQAVGGHLEEYRETFEVYGQRMAAQAVKLFG